jgi:nucleoside-diphosphate-sugar epimerase
VGKPSLLVIGCGDIGSAVARHFVAEGWTVWGVRRQPFDLPGARTLQADVTAPETLRVLSGIQPEFVLLVLTPGAFTDERYRQVYVEGLRNCLAALDRSRLRRVLWVSSTSVFHQRDGELLDEGSQAAAPGFSGRRLLEAEAILRDTGLQHTIVRLGGIYGPGRDRLRRQLQGGKRSPIEPVHYSNRIHRDDAVSILQFLLARAAANQPLHDLYLGVDAEPTPIATVERWFCTVLGVDYAELEQQDGELRGGNRRCSSARLQAQGYRFLYPSYREGLPTLLLK